MAVGAAVCRFSESLCGLLGAAERVCWRRQARRRLQEHTLETAKARLEHDLSRGLSPDLAMARAEAELDSEVEFNNPLAETKF